MILGCLFVGTDLYKDVKRTSDSHIGVPSQCFVARKASIGTPETRGRGQYLANLVSSHQCIPQRLHPHRHGSGFAHLALNLALTSSVAINVPCLYVHMVFRFRHIQLQLKCQTCLHNSVFGQLQSAM